MLPISLPDGPEPGWATVCPSLHEVDLCPAGLACPGLCVPAVGQLAFAAELWVLGASAPFFQELTLWMSLESLSQAPNRASSSCLSYISQDIHEVTFMYT